MDNMSVLTNGFTKEEEREIDLFCEELWAERLPKPYTVDR